MPPIYCDARSVGFIRRLCEEARCLDSIQSSLEDLNSSVLPYFNQHALMMSLFAKSVALSRICVYSVQKCHVHINIQCIILHIDVSLRQRITKLMFI